MQCGVKIYWWLYELLRILAGIFSGTFGRIVFQLSPLKCIVLIFFMIILFDEILKISNANDNDNMLTDIKIMFDCLRIQVVSNVYIIDAMVELEPLLRSSRLKQAVHELIDSIVLTNDIENSLIMFNNKFSNKYIDTLVIILRQALVSGQSEDGLNNAFDQMVDIEQAMNLRLENSLEKKVLVIQVFVLFFIVLVCGYCSIIEFAELFSNIK